MMLVLVLGLAWGALAATPLAMRARRARVDLRLRPLQHARRRASPVRCGDRVVDRALSGVAVRCQALERARGGRLQKAQISVIGGIRIASDVLEYVAPP